MDADEPRLDIVQKANPQRLIQMCMDGLVTTDSPIRAALHVAQLYLLLKGVRNLDSEFQAAWDQILEGRFMEYAAAPVTRFRMEWNTIWAAQEALQDLMERHNMGFQAFADPVREREQRLMDVLDSMHAPRGPEMMAETYEDYQEGEDTDE